MADTPVLQAVLRQLGGTMVKPTAKFLAWFNASHVPDLVVQQFRSGVLKKSTYVGSVMIDSADDIEMENSQRAIPIALPAGLLIVGSGPGGDPVVVDLQEQVGAVGYLCHESMWQADDVRAAYVRVAPSLAEFLLGIQEGTMPLDHFDAKKALKRDLGQ